MISYTGLETISNMSEESRSPRTLVPRAYKALVVAVLSIYALLPAVALSALPVTQQPDGELLDAARDKYAGDPILGIVQNMSLGRARAAAARSTSASLAATILLVAANAGTIGVSRLTYSLGQHQQLPERLRHISPRSRTPVVALPVFAVLACLAMVPGQGDLPRQHVRVRRDALVHDRARVADRAALAARAQPDAQAARRRGGRRRRGRAGTGRPSTCGCAGSMCRCSRSSAGS